MSPSPIPTGLPLTDGLALIPRPSTVDYVAAASEYVRSARSLNAGQQKAAQIRLSATLARVLLEDLRERISVPSFDAFAGEREVSGALRMAKVDVSDMHRLDGLRLAVELKPVNLAVGRAIWNRFGDIRVTAVNLHLKFPFAVIGGVLTFPTYEQDMRTGVKKSTRHLIARAISRLERAGGRRTEGDAPHLLEAVGILVYDPDSAEIDSELPPADSALRWEGFVSTLATAYTARFE